MSEALTSKVEFKGGLLVEGSIPDTSNEKVMLRQSEDKVRLKPGATSLMALEVENPDEADDPVESTLLQFEESDDHIEVARSSASDAGTDAGMSDPSHLELNFEVGDNVCEGLCNTIFEIEMKQAVKLAGGDVSQTLSRIFELDCTDDGDPKKCPKAAKPDAGSAGKTGGGAGSGSMPGSTTAARELRSKLNTVNMTACTCAEMSGTTCEAAPFSAAAIACANTAVEGDGALTAGATCLAANLTTTASNCGCEQTCLDEVAGTALGKCAATDAISAALTDCEIQVTPEP